MKRAKLSEMSVNQLVELFTEIVLEQDRAELAEERFKYTPLFRQMEAVVQELKRREGDQRRTLLRLYDHPNMHVRLRAAKNTLAVAPQLARQALEVIAESQHYPQALDAGMSLINLDRGIFKPT